MVDLVFGQISDLSHNASGLLNNFFVGVLGDDFEEYKGITTLPSTILFYFFLCFQQLNNALVVCVAHLHDSPYSHQNKET